MKTTKTQNRCNCKARTRPITFMLALLLFFSGMKAQVTIGDLTEPKEFSALEIVSPEGTGGMRLPQLTTAQRQQLEGSDAFILAKTGKAKGLTIFNITTNCVEIWNGAEWISKCASYTPAPVVATATVTSCIPYMFTYQTMNLTASYTSTPEVTPTKHQWIVDGESVTGATSATYAYTPPADIALVEDDLGNFKKTVKITCQIEIGGRTVQAADYEVLIVKATKGTLSPIYVQGHEGGVESVLEKVTLAHVNLGAENITDPCLCWGDLYQWGRPADGHEHMEPRDANPTTHPERFTTTLATNNVPGDDKFIYTSYIPYDWRQGGGDIARWGDGTQNESQAKANNDPCPKGWKVPSQKQWQYIYKVSGKGAPNEATANTFTKVGTWTANSLSAYIVGDALLLPTTGVREKTNGVVGWIGNGADYWSSTYSGANLSYYLNLNGTEVGPNNSAGERANGRAVRCIEDKGFNPDDYEPGSGTFTGKTCFDVVEINNAGSCSTLAERASIKADFSQTASNTQTYTFTPSGTVSRVRFYFVNENGKVIESVTPTSASYRTGNNISTACTATVKFNTNLNNDAKGLTREQALIAKVYVIYNDGASGNGADKRLELKVMVSDCTCCGAFIDNGVWLTFKCHNLGATVSYNPFIPNRYLHGAKYRFGVGSASLSMSADQSSSGAISGWSSKPVDTGSNRDWPTWNNPCPAGWRLPTWSEWSQVLANNKQTNVGSSWSSSASNYATGKMFGDYLFLPAAGRRQAGTGTLEFRGNSGNYWSSSTISTTTARSITINSSSSYGATTERIHGISVRCVAQ